MKLDWMPLDIPDYYADTGHLGALEHGIYLLLIMHYWRTGGLPDDDVQLARIARATPAEFAGARPIIEAFFLPGWKHKRIEQELEKARKISAKRSVAAEEKHALAPPPDSKQDASAYANAPPSAPTLTSYLNPSSPEESKKILSIGETKCEARKRPRNGQTIQSPKRIYVVKGSSEWGAYAEDYRQTRGAEPNVNSDGGRWFKILGEAAE